MGLKIILNILNIVEEVRDDSGKCVCNRAEGYIRKLDYCEPTDIQCDKPGIELSEQGNLA